mgnify:CR=1 FL=1|tara:strand:+ start:13527 stop:14267 length:741 start_codon:yes stop_codon:yes gene_type:complete
MLDENQIVQNWNDLEKIIETKFSKERTPKLKAMYAKLQDRMMMAPASGIVHYHNCFAGGYVDHVLRVIDCAKRIDSQWEIMGAEVTHTEEELIFSALNHDLGKVGDMTNDYYIPNPSEWHRKNQGKLYKFNPELDYMSVPDRSLFLLAQNGIKYSYNEAIAIRLHDGMYDDANIQYLKTFNTDKEIKSNLPTILHHADHMASRIEHDNYVKSTNNIKPQQKRKRGTGKIEGASDSANDLFKDFFKE